MRREAGDDDRFGFGFAPRALAEAHFFHYRERLAGLPATGNTLLAGLVVNATASALVEFPAGTAIYDGATTINFGTINVNGSTSQNVTLKNTGSQALTYTTALNVGAGYAITNGASGTIAPGGTATLEVTFNPTLSGNFADALQITTNDPAAAAFDILLNGTAVVSEDKRKAVARAIELSEEEY